MTDELSELLHQAATRIPDAPDRLGQVLRRRTALRSRRRLALVAAVAFVGLASAVTLAGGVPLPGRAARGPEPVYGGSGAVIAVPGRPVRFCSATFEGLAQPEPIRYCDLGIDVVGVDLSALTFRRTWHGAVEGQAMLRGHLRGRVLEVLSQGKPATDRESHALPGPPCQPPPGGWPHSKGYADVPYTAEDAYRHTHPDEVVDALHLRAAPDQVVVVVVVSAHVREAEAALRPAYGNRLCVWLDRFSPAQIAAVNADPAFQLSPVTQVYERYAPYRPDLQTQVIVRATLETAALRAAVARHPAGLVKLETFLTRAP